MKIQYHRADLFTTEIELIVHGCNAQGVMGSGVAAVVREKYPGAYDSYRRRYEMIWEKFKCDLPLGDITGAYDGKKFVLNAVTQKHYGRDGKRYASYDAIAHSFASIETHYGKSGYDAKQIAMPQIGAGLGGGDWNVISAIIESELKTIEPHVYILT